MVIDRLHDCLRQLATRTFPPGRHHDADGDVRLIERTMTWEGYVRLACDELRLAGITSPQVPRRMRAALKDLKVIAPPERYPPLDHQLALLTAAGKRGYDDDDDVRALLTADQQSIESGADMDDTHHSTRFEAGSRAGGRPLMSYPSLWTDLRRAGAEVIDQEVVIDGQLTTSRSPADLPAFCAAMVEQFAQARQLTRG